MFADVQSAAKPAVELPRYGHLTDLLQQSQIMDPSLRGEICAISRDRERLRWEWAARLESRDANDVPFPFPEVGLSCSEHTLVTEPECEWDCAICLQSDRAKLCCQLSPCQHKFHTACLRSWLRNSDQQTCPLCRVVVMSYESPVRPKLFWPEPEQDARFRQRHNLTKSPKELLDMYKQLGTWEAPHSVLHEVIRLRSAAPLLLPAVPPYCLGKNSGSQEQSSELRQFTLTNYSQALCSRDKRLSGLELAEWKRILAVKMDERDVWGVFDNAPFPPPRLWDFDAGTSLPLVAPDLLRSLLHIEDGVFVTEGQGWEMWPENVLGEVDSEQCRRLASGGFCSRASGGSFFGLGNDMVEPAWLELDVGVIAEDALLPKQKNVWEQRQAHGQFCSTPRWRRIAELAARFRCPLPTVQFFGEVFPQSDDALGPDAVASRWSCSREEDMEIQRQLSEIGKSFVMYPSEGKWPGPSLFERWSRHSRRRDQLKLRKGLQKIPELQIPELQRSSLATTCGSPSSMGHDAEPECSLSDTACDSPSVSSCPAPDEQVETCKLPECPRGLVSRMRAIFERHSAN